MKIICIGRNYSDHVRELNHQQPSSPIIFLKPESSIHRKAEPFQIPEWSEEIHHELEVVVRIDAGGKNIAVENAHRYFSKVGLGIDFTARDVQSELKAKAHPWERAKAFDGSAVLGEFLPLEELGKPIDDLSFHLLNRGSVVQEGNTSQMIFPVPELIAEVSTFLTLEEGDLLFSGTPAGVASVASGDFLEGILEGKALLQLDIA